MSSLYGPDLAQAHAAGYGFHGESAAPFVRQVLTNAPHKVRRVLDVGCGAGQWLRALADLGYDTVGLDVSPSMIKLAKKNSPRSKLLTGSVHQMTLPAVDAITAIGEPLNYLKDQAAIAQALDRIAAALPPGGVFVFDARLPVDDIPPARTAGNVQKDYAVFASIAYRKGGRELVRDITTFTSEGKNWRRADEQHVLCLPPEDDWVVWLRRRGFSVAVKTSYGRYALDEDVRGFVATKDAA